MVVKINEFYAGIAVDELLGGMQTVVKPLGRAFRGVSWDRRFYGSRGRTGRFDHRRSQSSARSDAVDFAGTSLAYKGQSSWRGEGQ